MKTGELVVEIPKAELIGGAVTVQIYVDRKNRRVRVATERPDGAALGAFELDADGVAHHARKMLAVCREIGIPINDERLIKPGDPGFRIIG